MKVVKGDSPQFIVIRTSDSITFKGCRRRWGWSSHLRGNLEPKELATPLWTGTGVHFALEDYHGFRRFPTISDAFKAYVEACRVLESLPMDYREQTELACGMLEYYLEWISSRPKFETLWIDGHPQCEVEFEIPLPVEFSEDHFSYDPEHPTFIEPPTAIKPSGTLKWFNHLTRVVYRGKIDRICVDVQGDLWVEDYKTAIRIENEHLENDPQATRYLWAASTLYDKPVVGMLYTQLRKELIKPPRLNANGRYSTSASQLTSHKLYYKALIELYTSIDKAPAGNIECLNTLAEMEGEDRDRFIQRDFVRRNQHAIQAEGEKILLEVEDMTNPDLPLYPNPTRMCSRYCSFMSPCLSMDDGNDWEAELVEGYQQRQSEETSWRSKIKWPKKKQEVQ